MPAVEIFLLILVCKDMKKLDKENYKKMFGILYEDYEKKRIQGLLYMLLYFIRRDLFFFIAFFMDN